MNDEVIINPSWGDGTFYQNTLRRGELILICGSIASGKTRELVRLAHASATQGRSTLFLSLELTSNKMIRHHLGLDKFTEAMASTNFLMCDTEPTLEAISNLILGIDPRSAGTVYDAVFIDSVDLMCMAEGVTVTATDVYKKLRKFTSLHNTLIVTTMNTMPNGIANRAEGVIENKESPVNYCTGVIAMEPVQFKNKMATTHKRWIVRRDGGDIKEEILKEKK